MKNQLDKMLMDELLTDSQITFYEKTIAEFHNPHGTVNRHSTALILGYRDLKSKVEEMQKTLDDWENAALIPCDTCGGGGFNGYVTGYDAVCDGCAGNGGYMGRATPQDLIEMIAKRMSKGVETE